MEQKKINGSSVYGKSLRYSLFDGIFATITGGIVSNYITPFALALKASNFHIGLLNSLPSFFGVFAQLKSPDVLEKVNSRVKIISAVVFAEAALYLSMALIPFFFKGIGGVYALVGMFTVMVAMQCVEGPIWSSLISDTVDQEQYGRYFAWRNRIFSVVLLVSIFLAGIALDLFKHMNSVFLGFTLLFAVSGVSRGISGFFLTRMTDIPIQITEKDKFSYKAFLVALPRSNYAKFVVYISSLIFTENIVGAFFAVYMFTELKFSYSTYMAINTAGALAGILTVSFWGRYSDKIGNAMVIKTASKFLPLIPVLWIFSKNPLYLGLVNMFGSYIWTGFHLAEFNFRFDACSRAKRTRAIAYSEITKSVAASIGALLGGFLAMNLPGIVSGSKLLTLFVLAGILRLIIVSFFSGSFREVRDAEKMSNRNFLLTILGSNIIENFAYQVVGRKKRQTLDSEADTRH
jgi:MFS family permease